jgi:hypothetical protein
MTYQENELVSAESHPMLKRGLAVVALLAAGGLLGSACADNESSLFIRACLAEEEDTCASRPDPSSTFIGKGLIDGLYYTEFSCPLLIGNQIVRRGSSDQLRTETSRITLYEANVRVVDVGGNAIRYQDGSAVEYSVPISGFVDPGAGSTPGYGLAVVPMLDGGSLQSVGGQGGVIEVVSMVTVKGRTLGGQELESPEWAFPISVCFGCLCQDTIPPVCCSDPGNAVCADLDDPITTHCSASEFYDCRLVGATCSQLATAAAAP